MSWAARRRLIIFLILGSFVLAVLATIAIATLYQAPSCSDAKQNQDETGIDCGGSCPYLCTAEEQPPTVLYAQPLSGIPGRTDVIASVENKNAGAAAKNVPYRVTLYGTDRSLVQQMTGTFELPPGATVPIYLPGIISGKQSVGAAFVAIDPSAISWYRMPKDSRLIPTVSETKLGGTANAPRISATLSNPTVTPIRNVKVVVVVHDVNGNVIGASQTIVPLISGQSSATASFTWTSAFSGLPVAIEIIPIIPLP